jgi:hypothetical protein
VSKVRGEHQREDREQVLDRLKDKLPGFNRRRLLLAASKFGTLSTQKKLKRLLEIAESKEHDDAQQLDIHPGAFNELSNTRRRILQLKSPPHPVD